MYLATTQEPVTISFLTKSSLHILKLVSKRQDLFSLCALRKLYIYIYTADLCIETWNEVLSRDPETSNFPIVPPWGCVSSMHSSIPKSRCYEWFGETCGCVLSPKRHRQNLLQQNDVGSHNKWCCLLANLLENLQQMLHVDNRDLLGGPRLYYIEPFLGHSLTLQLYFRTLQNALHTAWSRIPE